MTIRDASAKFPPSVVEIVPDVLYAVGWSEPTDGRISWVSNEEGRWLPLQCYVLKSGDEALVIDTSVVAHRAQVMEGLDALLSGIVEPEVMMTRYNLDTLSNLSWIGPRYSMKRIYTSLLAEGVDPDQLLAFMDAFEDAATVSIVREASGIEPVLARVGMTVNVGSLSVEILRPGLRLLATNWAYEGSTRTLFSTDGWGFATTSFEGPVGTISSGDVQISRSRIETYIRNKFDFLIGADTAPLAATLREIESKYEIDRLCGTLGAVVEGSEAVREVFAITVDLLEKMANEPYPPKVLGQPEYPVRVVRYATPGIV